MTLDSKDFKNSIYGHLSRVGKALSSHGRLHLIDLLCEGPKSVEQLAGETGMSVPNTSRHLQTLLEARLVMFEKQGLYSIYRIADPTVTQLFQSMQLAGEKLIKDISELVRGIYGDSSKIEQVSCDDLVARMKSGKVTLIDVRPRKDYEKGHLPGANSIPLEELESHLETLPPDEEIVAYCRGRYCLLSVEAVSLLQAHGYQALRLNDQ